MKNKAVEAEAPLPASKLWLKREVLAFCRISDSTLSRIERDGSFPRRVILGRRKVAWDRAAVERWAANLASQSQVES